MVKRYSGLLVVALLLLGSAFVVSAQDDAMTATIQRGGNDELGDFLVGPEGMTLYWFANDEPGMSACTDQCAENWPPLTVTEDEALSLADDVPGRINTILRPDSDALQVTYNGQPLYYWNQDMAPGDATGHGVGDIWFVAAPPTVSLAGNDELGDFLVGPDGMTLYWFTNDEPGMSNCTDQCAENWPPLTVDSADALTVQPGVVGEFSAIERADGTLQAAFNGQPLYYWNQDMAPGDATGHGVGDVWFVVKPPTVNLGGNEDLGDFLVGPDGMTLYLFTEDEGSTSVCYDNCATAWPPLLVAADEAPVAGEGLMGELGTTERDDGSLQVTYDGTPLYYWFRDVVPGDTTGQDVNGVWYVINPNDM